MPLNTRNGWRGWSWWIRQWEVAGSPRGHRLSCLYRKSGISLLCWCVTFAGEMGNDTIRQAWHDPSRITPEVYEGYRRPLRADNWDKALYEFTIAGNPVDYSGRLANLTMPVLVVTGDDDRIVPTEQSIQLSTGNTRIGVGSIERLWACPPGGMPGPVREINPGFSGGYKMRQDCS